jgi:hypothetical protein
MKTTLISRPIEPAFAGIAQSLGFDYGAALGAGTAIIGGAINYYGQKNAASQAQAQAAAAARLAEAQAAQAAAAARLAEAQAQAARGGGGGGGGGISTTYLLIGGAVLAGVLVFAMRRK